MNIISASFDSLSVEADALIVPVTSEDKKTVLGEIGTTLDAATNGSLAAIVSDTGYTGAKGRVLSMATTGRIPARRIILAGLGSGTPNAEAIRRGYGAAVASARDSGAKKVAVLLPGDDPGSAEYAVEGAMLATYRFTRYYGKARDEDPPLKEIDSLEIAGAGDALDAAIARGMARAKGVALCRDLSNEPASTLNPVSMAEAAAQVAFETDLEIKVIEPAEMHSLGMGAITAVGRGSANEPRMIHLTYRPEASIDSGHSIGIVGKCITFDTGGYSIKPYEGMLEMKGDMSGGSAVLGAMATLRALDCPHTVHCVICAAENMISGDAFRPGDILTAMNGVTIEILSTDAEGRLVLADGLVYCAKQGVEEMIDLATLTGAIVVALGDGTAGLFANDDALAKRLLAASGTAGERIWRMPLTEELHDQIKGDVGDIKNTGGRGGGAITAALFIKHFSEGLPWAHLDIAGCNRTTKPSAYTPKGATGWGVRTLVEYLIADREAKA